MNHFFPAYIDPGTGSMLLTVILSVVTALIFVFRGFFIKLKIRLQGGNVKDYGNKMPFVIFSDHKRYWNVFEPVCDEMERRGMECHYMTASPDDPALEKEYQHVKAEFIGEGNRCFARLNTMKANICLSTTPGLDVLQWKRSKDVDWYVHIFHALDDATMYRMFGLDYYDAVLLNGNVQFDTIRKLEALRGLPNKELQVVGSTCMDVLKVREAELKTQGHTVSKDRKTIILAPSWGQSSILNKYGASFIEALLSTGYRIIIRPHPQSRTSDKELLESLQKQFPDSKDLEWNYDNDNFKVLSTADLMISDFSGVIFDFCFIFDRPVIYAETNYDKSPYDACWLEQEPWLLRTLQKIGRPLREEDFGNMKEIIDDVLSNDVYKQGREQCRAEGWEYEGEAAVRTVDYLEQKLRILKTQQTDEPLDSKKVSSRKKKALSEN